MTAEPRSHESVVLQAPLSAVWEYSMDLGNIARFHPRVNNVDFVSGSSRRQAGVAYRCHLKDGAHYCVEKDIEVVPMERIVTVLPEDNLGIAKALPDYRVVTRFAPLGEGQTRVEFLHYYSLCGWKAWLVHLLGRGKIDKQSRETLMAIKEHIEGKEAGVQRSIAKDLGFWASRGATLASFLACVLFLALNRTFAEIVRLTRHLDNSLANTRILPLVIGAWIAAVGFGVMVLLLRFARFRSAAVLFMFTLALLPWVRFW